MIGACNGCGCSFRECECEDAQGASLRNAQEAVDKARQVAKLMNEISLLAERDPEVDKLICEAYPFQGSLDDVADNVIAWRDAMAKKAQVEL